MRTPELKTIIVENEQGRELNPHTGGQLIDGIGWEDNPHYVEFEKSVKLYPAPGLLDGNHQTKLVWEIEHNGKIVSEMDAMICAFKTRQIWVLPQPEETPESIALWVLQKRHGMLTQPELEKQLIEKIKSLIK